MRFIIKAKRVGLSLEEIKGILQLHDRDEPTCIHVRLLLEQKLAQAERVIRDLQDFTAELTQLRDGAAKLMDCKPLGGNICAIIEGSGIKVADMTLGTDVPGVLICEVDPVNHKIGRVKAVKLGSGYLVSPDGNYYFRDAWPIGWVNR